MKKITRRIKREVEMRPVVKAGYSRKMANIWRKKTNWDFKKYRNDVDQAFLKKLHTEGYLYNTLKKYGLDADSYKDMISDFDYIYLGPYNNSFSKWLQDIITTNRVLKGHEDCLREVYFSIIRRNDNALILRVDNEDREYTAADVVEMVKEKGKLELRPAYWLSKRRRFKMEFVDGVLVVNGEEFDTEALAELIDSISHANYIVSEYVEIAYEKEGIEEGHDHFIKVWMANDAAEDPAVLCAEMHLYYDEIVNVDEVSMELEEEEDSEATDEEVETGEIIERRSEISMINLQDGTFEYNGKTLKVDNWDKICGKLADISRTFSKLTYYTMSLSVKEDGSFKILSTSASPYLPSLPLNKELNDYLVEKAAVKNANRVYTKEDRKAAIKTSQFYKFVAKHCRPGIRPYMQALWMRAVWDDLWEKNGMGLGKKIWAWKRGFMSWRITQYGLTNENYKNFLSDYDYHWLNRINNSYQIWVNDKTTFRYILDPFKDYIPKYYYSIFNRAGETIIEKMQDCPEGVVEGNQGIFDLLKKEGKLALKPSAGTHGDGFYCLAYENGEFTVNGDVKTEDEIIALVGTFKSYYLITEYINMHEDLKKIYPKSVNSIRVMTINEHGHDPKIMQSYMRIGSSRTGFTDNVGYGGICVMVDSETGELYNPETITNHVFNPCPEHPDTGTPIAGFIPYWDVVSEKILDICRYLSELEYLGFDIAITTEGFQVIEINIHQDLHKVASMSDEVKAFYAKKLENKRKAHRI